MISDYQLYSVRLGSTDRPARDNFLNGPERSGTMRMDFNMWIAVGEDRTVVFDTGFSRAAGERRGRILERTPAEAVASLNVEPATVTDVVITHLHYDHAGNVNDFPQAQIWVQKSELRYACGPSMRHSALNHFFEREDINTMIGHLFDGNLRIIDGDVQLAAGIDLFKVGGHTPGLQIASIATARGNVVVASDALHYYENLDLRNPFPGIVNVAEMMDGYDKLVDVALSSKHIIAGHDPLVAEWFFSPDSNLPDGIVALHEDPTY